MITQSDSKVRVVHLSNLKAMCARVSWVCHRYWVKKVSRSRVHVCYSNPDEYGSEHVMTAVFPCYPNGFADNEDNPNIVLDILRVFNDNWHGEGWQAFDTLLDCPTLWRDPSTNEWATKEEIEASDK